MDGRDNLLPPVLPVGLEHEPTIGVPLLLSWVGLVAYVAAISGQTAPPPPLKAQLRLLQIDANINSTVNPCHDFYNYSCGRYPLNEPLDPWQAARKIAAWRVTRTAPHADCIANAAFFEDDSESGDADPMCDLQCRLMHLADGMAVNTVVARVQLRKGRLVMMYWSPGGVDIDEPAPWGADHVLRSADVVSLLNGETVLVSAPADLPTTCVGAVEAYAPGAIAAAFPPAEGSRALVDAILHHFPATMRSLAVIGQNLSRVVPPQIQLGGGPGLLPDMDLVQLTNTELWASLRRREALLVGTAVGSRWAAPASTVNAFFDADSNTVYLPSAITSPPFFSDSFTESLKFGGLGFIVAHELGHAIDHALNNTGYRHLLGHRLANLSGALYSDTKLTEPEAVADAYGLALLEAVHTADRITMLQTAQLWCMSGMNFVADPHPPGRWRVNSTFGASAAWATIFCP